MTTKQRHSPLFRGAALFAAVAACAGLAAAPASAAVGTAVGSAAAERPTRSRIALENHRGDLVSAVAVRHLSDRQVLAELADAGFDPAAAKYGVTLYRLVYRTVDEQGRPTTASGLLVLPHRSAFTVERALTTVFYGHGTQVFRGNAPSVTDDTWETAPPITYASAGFAAVAPDYLGLGLGPGQHPWMHVPSEVTASVDLLRAARTFTGRAGRALGPDVLVTGFSQGASVAMATAHAVQDGQVPGARLSAVAPISGAYDFRRSEIPALLGGELNQQWSVAYLAYLFVSWNRLHGLYDSPAEVFKGDYATTIPGLFDGEHPGQEVIGGLPALVDDLLTEQGRAMLQHPTGRFAAALRVADATCTDWTPRVPIRLYATPTDEQAAYANALACQTAFGDRGLRVPIVSVGNTDHGNSNVRATAQIVRWFTSL